MILRNWFYIISTLSFIAICSALIAEFVFDLYPCSMCLKQRHPYYFIIFIFILFKFIKKFQILWFFILAHLAVIYGLFYSLWHVGIEQKILKGPASCSSNLNISDTVTKLKEQITNKAVINCEDVIWGYYGISAATINVFLLILIFIVNSIYLKNYYEAQKN